MHKINEALMKLSTDNVKARLEYSPVTNRMTLYLGPGVELHLPPKSRLKAVLGFESNVIVSAPLSGAVTASTDPVSYTYEHEGLNTVDMNAGIDTLYVYTDIVEARAVGDVRAPLLRAVAVYGMNGVNISNAFDRVQYVPLLWRQFETIEIDIRDDAGQPIPFEGGKLVTTLQIRRCKSKLF